VYISSVYRDGEEKDSVVGILSGHVTHEASCPSRHPAPFTDVMRLAVITMNVGWDAYHDYQGKLLNTVHIRYHIADVDRLTGWQLANPSHAAIRKW
jgi:hypothetical protein